MPITLQTVQPSDAIDAGRTKFNSNDAAIAAGVTALVDQLDGHVDAGHPSLYYSKAEVDALVADASGEAGVVHLHYGYDPVADKVYFCGIENGLAVIPSAGSIVGVVVTDTNGYKKETTWTPGTNPVAAEDRLNVVAGPDILPGDITTPLTGGILLNVSGAASYQLFAFGSGKLGFGGFGAFAITVSIKLT